MYIVTKNPEKGAESLKEQPIRFNYIKYCAARYDINKSRAYFM